MQSWNTYRRAAEKKQAKESKNTRREQTQLEKDKAATKKYTSYRHVPTSKYKVSKYLQKLAGTLQIINYFFCWLNYTSSMTENNIAATMVHVGAQFQVLCEDGKCMMPLHHSALCLVA